MPNNTVTYTITLHSRSFNQLVRAGKFDWKFIFDDYKPSKPQGKKQVTVELLHFGQVTTHQEFIDYCKDNGFRPATFNEALELTIKYPHLQKETLMVTYDVGQLCFLYLGELDGGRSLGVCRHYPDGSWGEDVRFLAVRESLDSGKLGTSKALQLLDSLETIIKQFRELYAK